MADRALLTGSHRYVSSTKSMGAYKRYILCRLPHLSVHIYPSDLRPTTGKLQTLHKHRCWCFHRFLSTHGLPGCCMSWSKWVSQCYIFCKYIYREHMSSFESKECKYIDSLWLGDAIWRCRSGSSLFQVMACRLFGAKPLLEPLMTYY